MAGKKRQRQNGGDKRFSKATKLATVRRLEAGETAVALSSEIGVSTNTLSAWRGRFGKEARAEARRAEKAASLPLPVAPAPGKIEASLDSALAEIDTAARTLQQIRQALRQVFGL